MKRLLAVLSIFVGLIALVSAVLVCSGYRPFVLESPSIEPLYTEGSLCWINTRISLSDLQKGDVLVYRSPTDTLVLHRLIGIISFAEDELIVEMQGDANSISQEVTLSQVNFVGREAFTIPGLGSVVSAISSAPLVIYGLVAVLIILACIPHYRLPQRRKVTEEAET